MTEKFLREFLNYRNKADLLSQCKFWGTLYFIFVILFIDIHFFVKLGTIQGNEIWYLINTILTVLVLPLAVLYKKNINISQIFLFEAIIILGISIEFLYLFLFELIMRVYVFSIIHLIITLVMGSFIILALFYRKKLLKKGKKQTTESPIIYASIFSIGIACTFGLRFILKNSEVKNEILGYVLIILSFIFFMIACIDFQNFLICKRYGFKG